MRRFHIAMYLLVSACGSDDGGNHLPDAPVCTSMDPALEIVAPTAYACHDPFKSKLSITNNTCDNLTISQVKLTAMVTSGPCGPAGPGTYPAMTMALQPHESGVLVDITSGPFCCGAPGCAAAMQCDEAFTFEITTNAGVFSKTASAHIDLSNCDVVCP